MRTWPGTRALALPAIGPGFALGVALPRYWVALGAFVVFEAAYLGGIVRAGMQSVARGRMEAALASGLGYRQANSATSCFPRRSGTCCGRA